MHSFRAFDNRNSNNAQKSDEQPACKYNKKSANFAKSTDNIADIASLIQANGKDAITKLILAMTSASKSGVNDLSQLKDTAKLINASIALASTDNPAQTLKTLMLLYLPWLPLHEGAGFELEIETAAGGENDDESLLIITITTVNYGLSRPFSFLKLQIQSI